MRRYKLFRNEIVDAFSTTSCHLYNFFLFLFSLQFFVNWVRVTYTIIFSMVSFVLLRIMHRRVIWKIFCLVYFLLFRWQKIKSSLYFCSFYWFFLSQITKFTAKKRKKNHYLSITAQWVNKLSFGIFSF
jgi:hypothetical protein